MQAANEYCVPKKRTCSRYIVCFGFFRVTRVVSRRKKCTTTRITDSNIFPSQYYRFFFFQTVTKYILSNGFLVLFFVKHFHVAIVHFGSLVYCYYRRPLTSVRIGKSIFVLVEISFII